MREVIPTIVPESFADLIAKQSVLGAFASAIHIDVADGVFAPNMTWLPSGEELPDTGRIVYEAHLMVSTPLDVGLAFVRAGARRIIGHIEAFGSAETVFSAFDAWRAAGAREVGLALLLETSLKAIEPYLSRCDVVNMMTIATIGRQGIPFDARSIARIEQFHIMFPNVTIAVDGGENEEHIAQTGRAGATRFVVGSAIAQAADPRAVYSQLLERANAV
ncbi:MAG: hypothetical protein AAB605_01795 [Patescibacteria group bacterium]